MKIKLVNDESRKKIEQLNSRLKVLTNEIKGSEKLKSSYLNAQNQEQPMIRMSKKNYFKSATNLNYHENLVESNRRESEYFGTNKLEDFASRKQSPKFSSRSPAQNFPSERSPEFKKQKDELRIKRQVKEIIQSKKQFHSLIKKELSELQKLQEMMVEQPESWSQHEVKYSKESRKLEGQSKEVLMKKYMPNQNQSQFQQLKGINALTFGTSNHAKQSVFYEKATNARNLINFRQKADEGRQWQKAKTEESVEESQMVESSKLMGKEVKYHQKPSPEESQIRQSHNEQLPQGNDKSESKSPESQGNSGNGVMRQSSSLPMVVNRQQVEELLKEIMVIDYSDDNIKSVLKLVELDSIRSQNRSLLNNNSSVSSLNSQNTSNNSSLMRDTVNRKDNTDHIIEEEEQERHYRLIRAYKLLELILKIKHFAKLKSRLSLNLNKKLSQKKAIDHYNDKLGVKTFTSLLTNYRDQIQRQHEEYKIKTILVSNMLKKSSINQFIFNSRYKEYKFLSNRLCYEQELKLKSRFIKKLKDNQEQSKKLSELSELKQNVNKTSLFKVIREKYTEIGQLCSKYRLLKALNKHRAWNHFLRISRYFVIKKLIHESDRQDKSYEQMSYLRNYERRQNQYESQGITESMQKQESVVSSHINQHIVHKLQQYSSIFKQGKSQNIQFSSLDQRDLQQDHMIEYTQALILHIKQSSLISYLQYKRKIQVTDSIKLQVKKVNQRKKDKKETQINQGKMLRILLKNRKKHFVENLDNFRTKQINKRKAQHFCNITLGYIPQHIQSNKIQNNGSQHEVSNDEQLSQHSQQQISQESAQKINPFVGKYYKFTFLRRLKEFCKKSQKSKLQREVYDGYYSNQLLSKCVYLWKNFTSEQLLRKRQEQQVKKKQQQEQNQRQLRRKEQEQLKKQIEEQLTRQKQQQLNRQRQKLRGDYQQQLLLLKQQQNSLRLLQSQIKQQKLSLQQEQLQLMQKEQSLKQQQYQFLQLKSKQNQNYLKTQQQLQSQKVNLKLQERLLEQKMSLIAKQQTQGLQRIQQMKELLQKQQGELKQKHGQQEHELAIKGQITSPSAPLSSSQLYPRRQEKIPEEQFQEPDLHQIQDQSQSNTSQSNMQHKLPSKEHSSLKSEHLSSEKSLEQEQPQGNEQKTGEMKSQKKVQLKDNDQIQINGQSSSYDNGQASSSEKDGQSQPDSQLSSKHQEQLSQINQIADNGILQNSATSQQSDLILDRYLNNHSQQQNSYHHELKQQEKQTLNKTSNKNSKIQQQNIENSLHSSDQDNQPQEEQNQQTEALHEVQIEEDLEKQKSEKQFEVPHQTSQDQSQMHSDAHQDKQKDNHMDDMIDWLGKQLTKPNLNPKPTYHHLQTHSNQSSQITKKTIRQNILRSPQSFIDVDSPSQTNSKIAQTIFKKSQVSDKCQQSHEEQENSDPQSQQQVNIFNRYIKPQDSNQVHDQQAYDQQNPHQQHQQQIENQDQVQNQIESQSEAQSQLQSSNSPSSLRLLTYAQNQHSFYVKRLIFNHVFKYQTYKKQQSHDLKLLNNVFSHWKTFFQQKQKLKKYLLLYQQIDDKINDNPLKANSTRKNQVKSQKNQVRIQQNNLSGEKSSRRNFSSHKPYHILGQKQSIKYPQSDRPASLQARGSKQSHIYHKQKGNHFQQLQNSPDNQSNKVKYYPTSRQDLELFNSLFNKNQQE